VVAKIDWASVHLAGAFVLGAILATIATLRVTRAVADMFREQRRRDREGRP
jgi:uncharacterized protein (DUF2062 family)